MNMIHQYTFNNAATLSLDAQSYVVKRKGKLQENLFLVILFTFSILGFAYVMNSKSIQSGIQLKDSLTIEQPHFYNGGLKQMN